MSGSENYWRVQEAVNPEKSARCKVDSKKSGNLRMPPPLFDLLASSRAPLAADDDSGVRKAHSFESAGNFPCLFSQDARENQPAARLCRAGETWGGGDEDIAKKVGENDIKGPANGKLQHIAAGDFDRPKSVN
jgi:hypothetical protein